MFRNTQYVLDANVLIQAKRDYYAFDLCPGFWDSLKHHNLQGDLLSIDRVKDELIEGDEFDEWKKSIGGFFVSVDDSAIVSHYAEIINWAQANSRFSDEEKAKFANGTDAWVIAYAKSINAVVVTHEKSAPGSRKIKIPDVCKNYNIPCINTFGMLQNLNVSFFWNPPKL